MTQTCFPLLLLNADYTHARNRPAAYEPEKVRQPILYSPTLGTQYTACTPAPCFANQPINSRAIRWGQYITMRTHKEPYV
jgi:hypothetical protein